MSKPQSKITKADATDATETEATSNMALVAMLHATLDQIVPPTSSETLREIKAESDKLAKARQTLHDMGLPTDDVDKRLENLAQQESVADSGRAELVEALANLERAIKILGVRCSGSRVESVREKYAEIIEAGIPAFPSAVEMKTLANGNKRAVHGSRATQIVTALLNLSSNGVKRVSIEEMASRLLTADPTFGDEDGAAQQCRVVLQNFADVWTSDAHFVFSPN